MVLIKSGYYFLQKKKKKKKIPAMQKITTQFCDQPKFLGFYKTIKEKNKCISNTGA